MGTIFTGNLTFTFVAILCIICNLTVFICILIAIDICAIIIIILVTTLPKSLLGETMSISKLTKVITITVGDIPNRYTSDVVLNQQARVAHQGGMADCLPGGPVAGKTMAVLDAGTHGGSADKPMAGCLVEHA
jgi:hypothetical protein